MVVSVGELELHAASLGAGPAVVLLHGLFVGSMASWYFTAGPALAAHHRAILYDQRGHGRSSRADSGYDLATLRGDLAAVLDAYDEPRADLIGHSYGGLVALDFALHHPERVRRLVIVDAPLPPSGTDVLGEAEVASPADLLAMLPDDLRTLLLHGGRRARRFLASLEHLLQRATLTHDLAAEAPLTLAALAACEVPVTLIYGERSRCLEDGHHLAAHLPGATLHTLPAGHFLPNEVPAELTALLVEVLDG